MIILAHDGSIYNDWVARYAMRFATREQDRKLLVLNVLDGKISPEIVAARFEALAEECSNLGIEFLPHLLPLGPSVYRTLRQAIPPDRRDLLVCGTRGKPRRVKYFGGSISEKLLRMHQCPVLALRIVQPGLLGNPHDLLVPLAGQLHGFPRVEPILRRLSPQLHSVHLCRSMHVNPLRHPHLTSEMERTLRLRGMLFLTRFREEMEAALAPTFRCDQRVMVSSDWAHEVLMLASRLKTQLMLLGLSERSLAGRVLPGVAIEKLLHKTPCDVGIYRGL